MARLNLIDLAERSGSDAVVGLIEEVVTVAPELTDIPVRTKRGTTYRVTRRTELPRVGFRPVNAGVTPGKSKYTSEAKAMYFFDANLEVDEAIVKAEGGEGDNLGSILADESAGVMQSMGITLGQQVWQGQSADPYGFEGLNQQMEADAAYTLDATGTGTVGAAWLLWLDPGLKGVHLVVGNNGDMKLGDWVKQRVNDPNDANKKLWMWITNMSFYIGLAVHSKQSVWRIKNINAAHPLTDELGETLVARVPLARRAGLRWFMNRATKFLLQKSRASVVANIGTTWAPEPTALAGFPITTTDSLVDAAAA